MTRLATVWRLTTTDGVPRRAAIVAAIVGTVLTLINQGDALVSGHSLNWAKVVLTYCVPYLVNTHGAVSAALAAQRRAIASSAAR